ncbi:HypC/HybG/HupF family hydrogenase formation chaperone [Leptospirillum ferrooxidans]|jgi:hydrogenase expression/formation protein HypC|uniref:Putative hydrogenase assembly chaperone n=2 Tax=root TaxID=1 RepID=I0IS60_LEPFC|nr:HypC/HybG/HupF family hydrogenase formation chaperone [Leptospirillum ferrooxidans]MDA8149664.1 HypC/HybG/HupF family hydrogenase formation chaperone [Nitrospiraceae bacterium]BAM08109.1 putative hydrogenase assembly chaperone [Leptospirillum ferrooxidans C2-3]
MCLAIPACVTEKLDESRVRVSLGGIEQEVSTILLDSVDIGDYLIVHVGFALGKIDSGEALETLELMKDWPETGTAS